jgi:hypothetical protein
MIELISKNNHLYVNFNEISSFLYSNNGFKEETLYFLETTKKKNRFL